VNEPQQNAIKSDETRRIFKGGVDGRNVRDEGVAGSNPATPTKKSPSKQTTWRTAHPRYPLGGQLWGQFDAPSSCPIGTAAANIVAAISSGSAMCALTAISGAIHHQFAVKMMQNGDWFAHPPLWTLLVGPPS
jgi:hypothetical protein